MNCLECEGEVSVPNDAIQGEVVTCRDCGANYELVTNGATSPFTIRPAQLEEEDWGE